MVSSLQEKPSFQRRPARNFLKSKHVDANRDYEYEPPPGLERPPLPQVLFDLEKPTFNDFWKIVKRKRNSSSPGINGNSYVVYKSSKKIAFTVGITLLYLGKVWSPKLLDTSMDKTSGKERWLPLPWRYETNINFECWGEDLFLFGWEKTQCLYDSQWIHQKMAAKSFHGWSCWLYWTQYIDIWSS